MSGFIFVATSAILALVVLSILLRFASFGRRSMALSVGVAKINGAMKAMPKRSMHFGFILILTATIGNVQVVYASHKARDTRHVAVTTAPKKVILEMADAA